MTTMGEATCDRLDALRFRLRLLDPYLLDASVNEVAVNRSGEVWLLRGAIWCREMVPALDYDMLKTIGSNLANYVSKKFDRQHTILSAYLPSGERIEMTHAPTAPEGIIYLNVRKHVSEAFSHAELAQRGYYQETKHDLSLWLTTERRDFFALHLSDTQRALYFLAQSGQWEEFMVMAVATHKNIVIAGATGSGKTTYLRGLIGLIDRSERLITIEDTPEIPLWNPERPEYGHPNNNILLFKDDDEDEGDTVEHVVKSCMRRTGDRIIMGEQRGPAALYYLSGVLGSGHDGGMTTVHAEATREAYDRIAFLIKSSKAGSGIELSVIANMLYSTVHVVVQIEFDETNGRRVSAVYYDPIYAHSIALV